MNILLRVDIDFSFGLRKGVPWLLDLFDRHGVKATFFSVMGPDTVAKHGKRLGNKGYLKRIFSMNPLKMLTGFGPLFFLRGSVLPAAYVGKGHPDILAQVVSRGHQLGLHGYNHSWWADRWKDLDYADVKQNFDAANAVYRSVFGQPTALWASPNWRTVEPLYRYLESIGSRYTSNVRGVRPFFPEYGPKRYDLVEFPITMPALHEMVQHGVAKRNIPELLARCCRPDYNMWVIHCYYEGILERKLFEKNLLFLLERGARFQTLSDYFDSLDRSKLEACDISTIQVPGGFGEVSCQSTFHRSNYFALADSFKGTWPGGNEELSQRGT